MPSRLEVMAANRGGNPVRCDLCWQPAIHIWETDAAHYTRTFYRCRSHKPNSKFRLVDINDPSRDVCECESYPTIARDCGCGIVSVRTYETPEGRMTVTIRMERR